MNQQKKQKGPVSESASESAVTAAEAIVVDDDGLRGADALTTARVLAAAIGRRNAGGCCLDFSDHFQTPDSLMT